MKPSRTILTKQEQDWILSQKITRKTDDKEVLIYPMGAERYLSLQLFNPAENRYRIINDVKDKNILVIPGYGNSAFLFAEAGASSVTVYDKDPVTIAWIKAFKKYYHFREDGKKKVANPSVGELLTALTKWYPPLLTRPDSRIVDGILWILNPKMLRKRYLGYLIHLVQHAIKLQIKETFELDRSVEFYSGELKHCIKNNKSVQFDTVYVPYLLGVSNGIEKESEIVQFIKQLNNFVPDARIIVTPSENTKEFHLVGSNYFCTTKFANIQSIPGLSALVVSEDKGWFKTQGMVVFGKK